MRGASSLLAGRRLRGAAATLIGATAALAAGCASTAYRDAAFTRYVPLLFEANAAGGGRAFLFGALHVGTGRFYPLPEAIESRYRQADRLAIEIDSAAHWDELIAGFAPRVRLPPGQRLADLIDADLLQEVRAFYRFDDPRWAEIERLQPWWIANFRFNTDDDRAMGASGEFGSERFFLARARADGKPVLELETPADQIDGFSGGDFDEQRSQFIAWFDIARRRGGMMRELIEAWRTGDTATIAALKARAWGDADHLLTLRRRFFTARDARMAQRLARELAGGGTVFAAIGVFHLVGDDSVVRQLAALGVSVRTLDTQDRHVPIE